MLVRQSLHRLQFILLATCVCLSSAPTTAAELLIGAASTSITPEQPIALWGQMHTRISTSVESPCTATVLVLESVTDGKATDSTILVSCDAVAIPDHVRDKTREQVAKRMPGFPVNKIMSIYW